MEDTHSIVHKLQAENELRFVVDADNHVDLELLEGYAEITGAEVLLNKVYSFSPCSSVSLFTWKGCSVKVTGNVEKLELSSSSLIMLQVSIHACLEELRIKAEESKTRGPVSLVVGPTDVGKTSFCHMMLNYAARLGRRPIYIDLDVGQTSLSMPGTVSALPIERQADITEGFDLKSLTVYPFGHKSPGQNMILYYLLIKKLGQFFKTRMKNANPNTQASGMIIDTCGWVRGHGYTAITLAACSFEIDTLFVIEEEKLYAELKRDMPSSVKVVYVPKQHGVYERSRPLRAKSRDSRVREYFYGKKGDLIPHKLEVKFSDVSIYSVEPSTSDSVIDAQSVTASDINVIKVNLGPQLEKSILGLSFADRVDENFMVTNIIGFVCVTCVDLDKEVISLLSPQPGPLPSKILILGEMKLRNPNDDY